MTYQLEGRVLEACDCSGSCPCGDHGCVPGHTCNPAVAWHIDKGTIDGIDVSNVTLGAVSSTAAAAPTGKKPIVLYVDEGTTPEQQEALVNAWAGKLGGPLADLGPMLGEITAVKRAAVVCALAGGTGTLKIGAVLEAAEVPVAGAMHGHAAGAAVPAAPAPAHYQRADAQGVATSDDAQNRRVVHGPFRFEA